MKAKRKILAGCVLVALFLFILVGVLTIDVQTVGPEDAKIGFSTVNTAWRDHFPPNLKWYKATNVAAMIQFACGGVFALLGLLQLIRRKKLFKVDPDLLILGVLYILLGVLYVIFDLLAVNFRPFILDPAEGLEPSFPSSHTLLAVTTMGTAILQWKRRLAPGTLRTCVIVFSLFIMGFMVVGRVLSGLHWLTDIVASVCLSAALMLFYDAGVRIAYRKRRLLRKRKLRQKKAA